MVRADPHQEATTWFATLSRLRVSTAEVSEFFAWRRKPANKAAYLEVERAEGRRRNRFAPSPDAVGFSVIDKVTGEPATFANSRQTEISEADAEAISDILNRRSTAAVVGVP
jgi:hypothetical protein